MMRNGHNDARTSEQKFKWDEENRLLAVDENGFVSNYWYDADGERTVKTSGENEAIYVNSEFSGGNTGTARFSLYVSPSLVAGQGGKYTKHIYIGSQRIVSKLGDLASYGADPRRIPYAGNEADGLTINYKDKYAQQLQSIKDNYKTFDIPYTGKDNNDYVNGQGFCCDDGTPEAAQARAMARAAIDGNFKPNEEYEKMQFYYHPDHLGSSSYITNLDGEVSQHIEYVPFGEVFIEERNNTWNTPYLFNAKELDEETGMYYYGARYYEPKLFLWLSTDRFAEKYPNISPYAYCANNPVIYKDPNGDKIFLFGSEETQSEYLNMLYISTGNFYTLTNNVLSLIGADPNFKGTKSQILTDIIQRGIDSPKDYSITLVGESEDDKNVFIDSYFDRKIDISDLKLVGKTSSALQGALIGHYLNEIQENTDIFKIAHTKSLEIEGLIYGELIKDGSIKQRTEYPLNEPQEGFHTIIFEYGPKNKFQLEQGATSKKTGTVHLFLNLEVQEIEVSSTGELRSVKKVSQ